MKLKYFLTRKSLLAKVVDRISKAFLEYKTSSETVATDNTEPPTEARYIKLPYIGEFSELIMFQISKLLNVKFAFNTTMFKDWISSLLHY